MKIRIEFIHNNKTVEIKCLPWYKFDNIYSKLDKVFNYPSDAHKHSTRFFHLDVNGKTVIPQDGVFVNWILVTKLVEN